MIYYIACAVIGYLIGSIPFGYIIVKLKKGVDIRTLGSGNIGATNVGRVLGWPWGVLCFILDFLKGFFAIITPAYLRRGGFGYLAPFCYLKTAQGGTHIELSPDIVTKELLLYFSISGFFAIIGHLFPIYIKFRGGKGVATAFGVFLVLMPIPSFIAFLFWLSIFLLLGYVSLASLIAAISLPISFALLDSSIMGMKSPYFSNYLTLLIMVSLIFLLVVIKHISNIKRLIAGTEPKVKLWGARDKKKETNNK